MAPLGHNGLRWKSVIIHLLFFRTRSIHCLNILLKVSLKCGPQCNYSALCESLIFLWFTDCLTIGVKLITSIKPWSYTWFKFGLFNNNSNHPRMCVLSTLCGNDDKQSPLYICIYIYDKCHPYIYTMETSKLYQYFYALIQYNVLVWFTCDDTNLWYLFMWSNENLNYSMFNENWLINISLVALTILSEIYGH